MVAMVENDAISLPRPPAEFPLRPAFISHSSPLECPFDRNVRNGRKILKKNQNALRPSELLPSFIAMDAGGMFCVRRGLMVVPALGLFVGNLVCMCLALVQAATARQKARMKTMLTVDAAAEV